LLNLNLDDDVDDEAYEDTVWSTTDRCFR